MRLIATSVVSVLAGAALATGVMLWQPWGNGYDAAKCEAATKAVQEARTLATLQADSDYFKDILSSAGHRWERECHLQ